MKLAHTADWHLGHRRYDRSAPNGGNQREQDVELAVQRTLDQIIAAQPDLLLVAGDVFDSIRPPNRAILFLFQQLGRVRTALPAVPVIIIAGNHDSPRSSDVGVILPLYAALGVTVVQQAVQRLAFPGCTVTAVPSVCARQLNTLEPEGTGLHILLAHGDAQGVHPEADDFSPERVAERFAYTALGHYHVATEVAPRAWYAGSVEYTSTDPWSEMREQGQRGLPGKGFLLVDVQPGQPPVVTFQPVPTRPHLDLGTLDATGAGRETLGAMLAATLRPAALEGTVARLVVENVPRGLSKELDYTFLRAQKARALHLTLDLRRPAHQAATVAARAQVYRGLDQVLTEFLAKRPLTDDIDREQLQRLAQEYLAKVAPE